MKHILIIAVLFTGFTFAEALTISEVMSNPTGDDSGREWIEIYNEGISDIDLSAMTVSIKGGNAVVTTPLQGGLTLPVGGYAIIGSVVSGATKFLQDYPQFSGILFKSSVSLVNTGTTSIDIKLNGSIAATLPSYIAAKEGLTLSLISGSYSTGNQTPGAENQTSDTTTSTTIPATATTTDTQVTLPQMAPPSADILIYMPEEKMVVAGAEAEFSVFSQTRAGKPIADLHYTWAFGDGGRATGSSTKYRYAYSGRYIAQVEATNASVYGIGRMVVRVVPPDIAIAATGNGKYGSYIDIRNPNEYELDLSQWTLTLDGAGYPFPKNTLLPKGTTRFSGLAMGFASTTISTSTVVKILFPHLEEVTRYSPPFTEVLQIATATTALTVPLKTVLPVQQKRVLGASTTTAKVAVATSTTVSGQPKDKRIANWLRSLFNR